MLVSTAETVTHLIPQTVITARVTYRTVRASRVNLDGLECIVLQVRLCMVNQHKPNFKWSFSSVSLQQCSTAFDNNQHSVCTECKKRWYGINCSQQCVGNCNDRTPCNHVTGQCDGGCDVGWTGKCCDKRKYFNLTYHFIYIFTI